MEEETEHQHVDLAQVMWTSTTYEEDSNPSEEAYSEEEDDGDSDGNGEEGEDSEDDEEAEEEEEEEESEDEVLEESEDEGEEGVAWRQKLDEHLEAGPPDLSELPPLPEAENIDDTVLEAQYKSTYLERRKKEREVAQKYKDRYKK